MKRRLQALFVIVALVLSSSSGALAAVLCQYAGHLAGSQASCCPEQDEAHGEPQADGAHSSHQQVEDVDEHCASRAHEEGGAISPSSDERRASSLSFAAQRSSSCTHCLGRPKNAPASQLARDKNEQRRDDEQSVKPAPKPLASELRPFVPAIIPNQGSPPGDPSRRRLMLGTLLI